MYGIFVNEDGGIPYAQAIVKGYKTIETRNKAMLRQLVGERVAVIRTRHGKSPMVLGYVDIVNASRRNGKWMDENRDLTLIPPGSKYDANGQGKWCYFLSNPEQCVPYPLPTDAIRHGRSWCEFNFAEAEYFRPAAHGMGCKTKNKTKRRMKNAC